MLALGYHAAVGLLVAKHTISYLSRDETELRAGTEAAPNQSQAGAAAGSGQARPPSPLGPRALTACAEPREILAEGLGYRAPPTAMQQTCQAMAS